MINNKKRKAEEEEKKEIIKAIQKEVEGGIKTMARDHTDKKEEAPQIMEREINLTLINAKLNDLTGLLLEVAKKVGVDTEED